MRKNRLILLILTIAMVVTIIGCSNQQGAGQNSSNNISALQDEQSQPASSTYPVTVTDVKERNVTLEKKPEKIVSLTPSNTEILFALGLGDSIVGVDKYSNYPEQANSIKKVGDFNGPNIELIAELKPDLVVAGGDIQEDAIKKLENLGIPVISSEAGGLEDLYKNIDVLGKATDTQQEAQELITKLKNNIQSIAQKVASLNKPKVYFNVDINGFYTAGKGTFISQLIEMAGGKNVADDVEGWPQYSVEKIIEKNPDIIITTEHAGTIDDIKKISALKNINAVKDGKIYSLDADIINRIGPRVDQALEEMAKVIHPEVFK